MLSNELLDREPYCTVDGHKIDYEFNFVSAFFHLYCTVYTVAPLARLATSSESNQYLVNHNVVLQAPLMVQAALAQAAL